MEVNMYIVNLYCSCLNSISKSIICDSKETLFTIAEIFENSNNVESFKVMLTNGVYVNYEHFGWGKYNKWHKN
jgi:hypothetical protein